MLLGEGIWSSCSVVSICNQLVPACLKWYLLDTPQKLDVLHSRKLWSCKLSISLFLLNVKGLASVYFCHEVIGASCEFGTAESVKPLYLRMDAQLNVKKKETGLVASDI